MDVSVFFFGLFIGLFLFTMENVVRQSVQIWKRTRSLLQVYPWMIWVEALVNLTFAITTRLNLDGVIKKTEAYYIGGAMFLWALQTQLLSQIIANRISLIMVSRRKSLQLRWGLFISITVVNIAVGFIWTPAHMPDATEAKVHLNYVFEYVEKSFFLCLDLSLNLYFLYLVRYRLIAEGLVKYWTLYNYNICFVVISTIMDALLLGLLSLPDQFTYIQFAPVTYTVKLYLELRMAQLISKVVRRSMNRVDDSSSQHRTPLSRSYRAQGFSKKAMNGENFDNYDREAHEMNTRVSVGVDEGDRSASRVQGLGDRGSQGQGQAAGIMKTITTVVATESRQASSDGASGSN